MPGVDNSITLLQSRITDFQARIDPKEKQIALKVNLSAQYKKVLDEKELRGIIRIQAIISGEEKDEFYISATDELTFGFDEEPLDFDQTMNTECLAVAVQDVSNKIDGILDAMGNPKLNLASSIPAQPTRE